MASVQKTAKGYRVQVAVLGRRDSATFRTQREANAWGAAREAELRGEASKTPGDLHSLADAIDRYCREVCPTKRGSRWEEIRLNAFLASPFFPKSAKLASLTPDSFVPWRDNRMATVSAGTVRRELGLLGAVLEHARREWRWIEANPLRDLRKPKPPEHRSTVITRRQIKALLESMGYSPRRPIRSISQAAACCFLMALRTGMRAGEITGLEWGRVFDGYCWLPVTKTTAREVPLSRKAARIVGKMEGFDKLRVFGIGAQTLDALFRRHRDRVAPGIVFHDTRHTAATWMARRLNVLDLCKAFGWSNPKMAMTYYNPTAAEIARRM